VTDLIWQINTAFYFNVTNNMTTYIHVDSLKITLQGYYNNTESISLFTFRSIILPIATGVITGDINDYFKKPVSLSPVLDANGLSFLN